MKIKRLAILLALSACSLTARAQSAGSFIVSAGWDYFMPHSHHSVDKYTENGIPGDAAAMNLGLKANKPSAFGLTGTYFITDNLAAELMLNTPAKLSLSGADNWDGAGEIASANQWSPALLLKYYFGPAETKLRPFVGAGLSRTWFTKARARSTGLAPSTSLNFSIENQWALVLNGGLTYQFDDHWSTGLSVSYMPLRPRAHLIKQTLGEAPSTVEAKLKLNPVITFLNVGYRF